MGEVAAEPLIGRYILRVKNHKMAFWNFQILSVLIIVAILDSKKK